jgi:hypothetical protein
MDKTKKRVKIRLHSVQLFESPLRTKKYRAVFFYNSERFHHVDFGGYGYRDFVQINDPKSKWYIEDPEERLKVREDYIRRHDNEREDWDDPFTAGALSRWVLWEKPTLEESWDFYKRKFRFTSKVHRPPPDTRF